MNWMWQRSNWIQQQMDHIWKRTNIMWKRTNQITKLYEPKTQIVWTKKLNYMYKKPKCMNQKPNCMSKKNENPNCMKKGKKNQKLVWLITYFTLLALFHSNTDPRKKIRILPWHLTSLLTPGDYAEAQLILNRNMTPPWLASLYMYSKVMVGSPSSRFQNTLQILINVCANCEPR